MLQNQHALPNYHFSCSLRHPHPWEPRTCTWSGRVKTLGHCCSDFVVLLSILLALGESLTAAITSCDDIVSLCPSMILIISSPSSRDTITERGYSSKSIRHHKEIAYFCIDSYHCLCLMFFPFDSLPCPEIGIDLGVQFEYEVFRIHLSNTNHNYSFDKY